MADGLDERARSEVLARAFIAFAGGLHVHIHRGPVILVNHCDEVLEVDGIVEARHGQRVVEALEFLDDVGHLEVQGLVFCLLII